MKKVAFTTLGCRFNQHETAEMSECFKEKKHIIVPFDSEADLYVINTCTVTKKSDTRCRQIIRKTVQKNPGKKLIVTGCLADTNKEELLKMDGVDFVLGNRDKLEIVDLVEKIFFHSKTEPSSTKTKHEAEKNLFKQGGVTSFNGRTSAYLKVQTGCDMHCSFCIVTKARGDSTSDSIKNICAHAEQLVTNGFQEIVLTGINLGCYGHDLDNKTTLATLLNELLQIKNISRIRLSSINPTEVSEELITTISSSEKICRYLHLPLQSGDDIILRKMNRHYSVEFYFNLITQLYKRIPGIGIGSDVMVGFPGETEEQFQNTYNFIESIPLSYLHVFAYSPRTGTEAATYDYQVSKAEKSRRSAKLRALSDKKRNEFREKSIKETVHVLFENTRDRSTNLLKGYTDNYIPVVANGPDTLMNRITPVTLRSVQQNFVEADVQF